jgi:hypothetical protein
MLTRQIKAVFVSYLGRRAYHGLLLAMAVGFALAWLAGVVHLSDASVRGVLFRALIALLLPGSAIVGIVFFFLQAREQLMGLSARLMPQSRTAHLIVIGMVFCIITVAISSVFWERPHSYSVPDGKTYWTEGVSPAGETTVILTLMTLAAYTAYNLWLLPVLGVALILWVENPFIHHLDVGITIWWPQANRGTGLWAAIYDLQIANQWALRTAIFLANVTALEILVKLAKPRPARTGFLWAAIHRMINATTQADPLSVAPLAVHAPMIGLLSRGRHRRYAVHSHAAPWVLAAVIAGVLVGMMLGGVNARENDKVMAALVMLNLVPGVVVAAGWRERWASLGYESLLPSPRRDFVGEIAVALASDLVEFWVAALVMTVLVLAVFARSALPTPAFGVSIVASAMMQFLWLGAIFLASRFRQIAPYVVILIGIGLAMLLPVFHVWSDPRIARIPFLIAIALTEMTCGVILLFSGLGLWRSADLS